MNGKQNGNGTFHFQNGDKYSGDFKDGHYSGQVKMTNSNGETYEGELKDGKKHGTNPRDSPGCVRLLLEAGADPSNSDVKGKTPLHTAC